MGNAYDYQPTGDTITWENIPRFTKTASYQVDVGLGDLEHWLNRNSEYYKVEMDPDFQRAHVWTPAQQSRFVEFMLRGGKSSRDIYWNCPAYGGRRQKRPGDLDLVLVDGKQRLEAMRAFLRNEVIVFGKYRFSDFTDQDTILRTMDLTFRMHVNDLPERADVLRWYLDINRGGVAHSDEEIAKVEALLEVASSQGECL